MSYVAMRTIGGLLLLLGLVGSICPASAQTSTSSNTPLASLPAASQSSAAPDASLFYVAEESTILHNLSSLNTPVARLSMRTPVTRLRCTDKACRVRTESGDVGYVARAALSNVWIRVSKEDRRVYVYRGPKLVDVFEADMAYNAFADKKRNGSKKRPDHWRTPEGAFYVVHKNPDSRFYKAFVLNYPKVEDARRGLESGLISRSQYRAIKRAQERFQIPPMNTDLGGWIEIHGDGTGDATAWTQGCVAVRNRVMDKLWDQVRVGTPVLVE
jgi:lipoprotein-anchoring transpeptidase ErfK/SrfK